MGRWDNNPTPKLDYGSDDNIRFPYAIFLIPFIIIGAWFLLFYLPSITFETCGKLFPDYKTNATAYNSYEHCLAFIDNYRSGRN